MKANMKKQTLTNVIFTVIAFFSYTSARDILTPTEPLADNATLISSGGNFALGFFTPANSKNRYVGMWFNKVPERRIVWVANRENPVVNSTGLLSVSANGTMMITNQKSGSVVWSVATTGLKVPVVQLLDNGNFVLKQSDDEVVNYAWQSFHHPTDTMLAGMKLGLNWTTRVSDKLSAWKTENDPSVGEYYMGMATDSDIYLYSSKTGKVWRSGPWDGINLRRSGLNYSFIDNSEELEMTFGTSDEPMILVVTSLGKTQLLSWSSDEREWAVLWEKPENQCDLIGHCGPNGVCDINASPMCSCLKGYVPNKSGSGCVRKMGFDCRNGTDVFVTVSEVKLPLSSSPPRMTASSLDECRLACLNNCSCSAYTIDGGENGCVIWVSESLLDTVYTDGFEQDLFLRVSSAYLVSGTRPRRNKHMAVFIVLILLLGILVIISSVICFLWRMKKKGGSTEFPDAKTDESSDDDDLDIQFFDFYTIEAATNRFSAENELGHGGFGTVYKGKLDNDQEIAVKRLATTSLQGTSEFKNEVKLIVKLQNINLVQLLGCCMHKEERMLIYEYMPNKSLDFFLFDKEKGALLDWQTRYQIIVGIARGLLYLHHDSLFRIIHRDLKASNILLDESLNPKISDFGMAKLFGGDETDFNTRRIVGTYGYMSPEYAMEGFFSLKSDVFSFGVLMLEILSGKKNRGDNIPSQYLNLVAQAWRLWTYGESMKLVDKTIKNSVSEEEFLRCVKVSLLCVQDNPEDRPLMSSVIVMLGADISSLPEPNQPGFLVRFSPEMDKKTRKNESSASNELTNTLVGR